MKLLDKAGFTIIETMLFLGITALLVMGVLVGTGTSINIQRYRDSVSSLQSILQQQYSDALYVDNDRDSDWSCDSSGAEETSSSSIARGQSNCVILGRYITTYDSRTLSIRSVVGNIPTDPDSTDDVTTLQEYEIKVLKAETAEIYELEWGSSLMKPPSEESPPSEDDAMYFSMLILRSPLSGILRTFINSDEAISENEIPDLVNETALTQSAKMCIDSNGLFNSARTAILINANSASASGVEVLGEATSEC